ncbi:MAG: threonine synthase, partial [Lachnospiraceae bacterium]|nr:threonine synthase [Lachnospiraceae bacterium]
MELFYRSTRSNSETVRASQAILKGLADDGGLYVPESVPRLDRSLADLSQMTYQETAYEVMKQFLTDFSERELKDCINKTYYI